MKKTIILDAGHSIKDSGASVNNTTEAKEAIKIRDMLVPLLKQNFEVIIVPDDLNLVQSINWVNSRCPNIDDGFALAIHFNAGRGYGAETFYYTGDEESRKIAQIIIDKYCNITRFRNRGAKPDRDTRFGKLGWIRDIRPWSCLIECCFIDNQEEISKLQEEYSEIAWALYSAICAIYNVKPINLEENKMGSDLFDGEINIIEQVKIKIKELTDLAEKL